jgi:hypothetical protein
MEGSGKHFVLVHGLCHGAWSWYKVVAALQSAGHRVTALDLAASGAHPARLGEVRCFEEYSRPLLDAVAASPDGERLVLVGHSHGGLSLALAMERFPRKIAAAVFVAAALPCVGTHMGVATEEVRFNSTTAWCPKLTRRKLTTSLSLCFFPCDKFMRRTDSKGLLMDCQVVPISNNQGPGQAVAIHIGQRFMAEKYYQHSPAEARDNDIL